MSLFLSFVRLLKNHFKIIFISSFLSFLLIIFFSYNFSSAAIISKSSSNTTLKNGLVGWWTFDGPDTTANTTTDKSGQGNDGTRTGVTITTGKIGQAMRFNGVPGNISATGTLLTNPTAITISAWIKPATTDLSAFPLLIVKGTVNTSYVFFLANGKISFRTKISPDNWVLGTTSFVANKWYHVVGTFGNGANTIRVYVNGVQENSNAIGGFDTNEGNLNIGANSWVGLMDDVRIYNRALSPAEIAQLYSMGGDKISKTDTTKPTLKTGLVGHWTFDGKDVTATTVLDKSGNNNTGTKNTAIAAGVGKIGQGIVFNETPQLITIPYTSSLSLGNTGTISFWVKPKSTAVVNDNFFSYGNASQASTDGFDIITVNNNTRLAVYWKSGASSIDVDNALSLNVWQQITLTNRGGALVLYKNGVSIGSGTSNGAITTTTISYFIGGENQAGWFTNATMDDVRVYNRALSPAEIAELYTQGGGKINKTDLVRAQLRSGLVGHWTFDGKDVTANTTTDKSGQGNDGTRNGTTKGVTGKIGQGMYFAGNAFALSGGNTVTGANPYTLSSWVKVKSFNGNFAGFLAVGNGAASQSAYIGLQNDNTIGGGLYGANLSTGITPTLNKWYHVVQTYNTDLKTRIYVNGILIGTPTSQSPNIQTASMVVGAIDGIGASHYFFNGSIDDVRVYNRALSQAEITELYRMGK